MLRIFLLAAGLSGAGVVVAKDSASTADAAAGKAQQASMRLVHGLMSDPRYALHARTLEKSVDPTFARFVDALDEQRLFLTQADLRELDGARADLARVIPGSDGMDPVFVIFRRFTARVDERVAFARARLLEPADYAATGTWEPDRSVLSRAADNAALDDDWRRLVRNDRLELHLAGQADDAIRQTLDARYADMAQRMHALTPAEIAETFVNAYVEAVDPGGSYYAPRDPMSTGTIDPALVGIGILVKREGPFVVVQSVVPGGPAAEGDVHPGDRILAIGSGPSGDWTDVVGARVDNVVEGMRGKPGTVCRLRLGSPAGARRDVALARARIHLADEVATRSLVPAGDRRIGVITLPQFYRDFAAVGRGDPGARSSVADVQRLLRELRAEKVDGVILDLRGNGGGSLIESVEMSALFVGRQPVVQIRESSGRVSVESGSQEAVYTGPLAMLVDEATAAASEIVAAALQDHGRAIVIGTRTFGRGSVQNMLDLDRWPSKGGEKFGMVKMTIAEFFRPDGRSIAGIGVVPDVALPDPGAAAPRAGMSDTGPRIPPAAQFKALDAAPAPATTALESDPAFRAWRERWRRVRALAAGNALALDAPTRRATFATEREDATAARQRDDALQAAAVVLAGSLPAPVLDAAR